MPDIIQGIRQSAALLVAWAVYIVQKPMWGIAGLTLLFWAGLWIYTGQPANRAAVEGSMTWLAYMLGGEYALFAVALFYAVLVEGALLVACLIIEWVAIAKGRG